MPPPAFGFAGAATALLVPATDGGHDAFACLGDVPSRGDVDGLGEVPPTVAPLGELSPPPNLLRIGCSTGASQRMGLREPSSRLELVGCCCCCCCAPAALCR